MMNLARTRSVLLVTSALTLAASAGLVAAQDAAIDKVTPVTDEMLSNPPDGDWLM